MLVKAQSLIIIGLLSGCAGQEMLFPAPYKIMITGNTLVFDGVIAGDAVLDAIRMMRTSDSKIETLRITSPGGEIASGIEFGYFVKEKGLEVEVSQLCFSACANYILTAASHITIKKDALIGWHGGANQSDALWKQSVLPKDHENLIVYINRLRIKEAAFFDAIQVDQKITTYGQVNRNRCQAGKTTDGWYYSQEDLKKMGVDSVEIQGGTLLNSMEYNGTKISACLMPNLFS